MKYCEICGAELTEDMLYCSQCGQKVPDTGEEDRDFWAEHLCPGREEEACEPGKPDPLDPFPEDYVRHPRKKRSRRPLILIGAAAVAVIILIAGIFLTLYLRREPVPKQMYYGRACTAREMEYSGEGDWVALSQDGSAEVYLIGTGGAGTWTERDGKIFVTCGHVMLQGTLQDQVLILSYRDYRFVLSAEGVEVSAEAGRYEEPAAVITLWEGEYYGWWRVSQAWGAWADSAGEAWDVCGRIWLESENLGKLELWDTECAMGELFCAADIEIGPGLTEAGCLQSGIGRFCDYALEPGAWVIDPGREPYAGLPNLLCLTGTFQEGDSGFSYEVFLRPWGTDWKDVKSMASPLLPAGKRLPPHYSDWYLPKLQGKSEMPESFYDLRREAASDR